MWLQGYICALIFSSIKRISKRKKRVENIELELIMSDIAIGYLGALISFASMKYFMFTLHRGRGGGGGVSSKA